MRRQQVSATADSQPLNPTLFSVQLIGGCMNSCLAQRKSPASANFFAPIGPYRRLPCGRCDAGRRAGGYVAGVFCAAGPDRPATTGFVLANSARALAWLHADDLELWLAELCRMGLIEPGSDAPAAAPCRAEPAMVRAAVLAEPQFEAPPQNPRAVLPNPQADDLDFCRMGSTEPRSEASAHGRAVPLEPAADAPAVPSRAAGRCSAARARAPGLSPAAGGQLRQGLETGQP